MRFKNKQKIGEIPEVDITPMLNVIMVVLAFFIVVSTTLTGEPETVRIDLPNSEETETSEESEESEPPPFLTVKVDSEGEITVDDRPFQTEELLAQIPAYLENNPESFIYLIPNPDLPYEQVIQLLASLRDVGSDRVSLAVGNSEKDSNSEKSQKLDE